MLVSPSKNIWGLIILGGIIIGFAYHSWTSGFLAWIGFVPFLYALSIKNELDSFVKGYLFGFIHNLIAFYWIGLNSGATFYVAIASLIAAVSYL